MKRLAGSGLRTRRLGVVAVLVVILFLPRLGMAGDFSEFMRNDVDWAEAGDFNVHIDQMYLDDSEWAPVQDQLRIGAEIDFTNSRNWAGGVIGFSYANEEESVQTGSDKVTIDSRFIEVYLGIRKVFYNFSYVRPFVGLGGTVYSVDLTRKRLDTSDSDNDIGFGGYAEAGLYIDIYGPFHVGGNVRYGAGLVDLFDAKKNPGGFSAGAMIGIHWVER